jgi:hypothetical protein
MIFLPRSTVKGPPGFTPTSYLFNTVGLLRAEVRVDKLHDLFAGLASLLVANT